MNIARLVFNPLQENTYVVWDESGEAIIVDAGNASEREMDTLRKFGADHSLRVVMAVNTHGHFDHLLGVAAICDEWKVPFALSSKDEFLLREAAVHAELFGVRAGDLKEIDIDLDSEQTIRFGNSELRVIKTPGHTPGHVCLYSEEHKVLFTGDTLFRESIGRTDLPGGDYSWIMRSILDSILPLGDEVKIYPGHGDASDLGHEAMYNPFIVECLNEEVHYE